MANMRNLRRVLGAMLVAIGALFFQPMDARASDPIRIAIGDVPGADWLIMLVAIEHAKAQGLDIEVLWLNQEDTANQAVLNGQAELGSGTPYTIIQNVPDQMRFVFQNYKVQFYPVANKAMFPDWASTNGQPIVLHSQAGATTVMAHLVEQEYGIEFSDEIFLPGSEVRATAMLQGTANLTYVDATNKDRILAERPGEFHVLPSGDLAASDEAMFARIDWIDSHRSELETLIESFLHVYRRVAADPFYAIEERARLGLLPELPAEMDGAVEKYMIDGAADSIFPPNLGGRGAAELDIRFFAAGGQIEGDPASLRVEDFWDLGPLESVLARVGTASASFTAP
jgi:NitT/TauT family transport system substrate-binding protein